MMEKTKKIYFPVYDYTVQIVVGDDPIKSAEKRHINCDEISGGAGKCVLAITACPKKDHPVCAMFLRRTISAGGIAHECWHSINKMCTWTGMTLDDENVGYHLGYLVQHVYDFITSLNKKK